MADYTFATDNKRQDEKARKDALLELIGAELDARKLKITDVRQWIPSMSKRQLSDIRQGMRSAASIDRLEELAEALGLIERQNESTAVAA